MRRTLGFAACLALLFALVALPGSSRAQDDREFGPEQGDWELTLSGTGSNDDDFDAGSFGASGSVGYFFTDYLELVLRQSVTFADAEGVDSTTIGSTRVGLDLNIPLGRVVPFVGFTIGGVYGDEVDETGTAAPLAGLKIYALEKTFLYAQAEWDFFFDEADEADEAFDDGFFAYTIGLGFNW